MLSHERVWAAIDQLALKNDLSPSGLARRAGLDPTTFNESKRIATGGRPRWPSTESIAKILDATGARLDEFAALMETGAQAAETAWPSAPTIGFASATGQAAMKPADGSGSIPSLKSRAPKGEFTYTVTDERYLPLYRPGDIVIADATVPIRRGDRILMKRTGESISVAVLDRNMPSVLKVRTIGDKPAINQFKHSEIDWIARILWVSQ